MTLMTKNTSSLKRTLKWYIYFVFISRAVCFPMAERQPFYKYIIATIFLATGLEFSRFFEFKMSSPDYAHYETTCMAENPYYVQFNSYWNEIFATGLVPLILLCFMNLKIFQKIKVSQKRICENMLSQFSSSQTLSASKFR